MEPRQESNDFLFRPVTWPNNRQVESQTLNALQ